MLIKSGDTVLVIAGADKGVRARVLKIDRETQKAIVEGVNKVYKHVKRSQKNPQGGRLSKEMPVQLSNLQYVCEQCTKATRLGVRFLADGSKERHCRKCDASAGQIAPARAAHANG
ncbi:50S ribosomal protein L24 [Botrimarina hoheduenensis]|uniref:Large ribosomal subunit protein uL24 n=1 Tax=Botrimarina hoheduenensis TaxID=2528000 RepID=A0A5C5W987_9BACT|nr:50S ribosomal protein L24 [Botrimarina hoheduenensis]TWT46589.1 50S ribosomal protein L24 [Botrimarina hoheduenensis]